MRKIVGSLLLLPWLASAAELSVPLHYGMKKGVIDEWGQLLEGTAASPGALVQILAAPNGIYPPGPDGVPDANNPVLAETYIGQGTDPSMGPLGKAAGSVMLNRYQANKIFARVFNRPTLADSSFYTDSSMFTNSTTTYGVFIIAVNQTDKPIDTGDDDHDGLINALEKSMGTDQLNPDSDGDGVSDYDEMLAGTSSLDGTDYLQMVQVIPQANGAVMVKWQSVPAKKYQVQSATLDLLEPGAFENVGPVIEAISDETMTIITNLPGLDKQHFRILLTP